MPTDIFFHLCNCLLETPRVKGNERELKRLRVFFEIRKLSSCKFGTPEIIGTTEIWLVETKMKLEFILYFYFCTRLKEESSQYTFLSFMLNFRVGSYVGA